MNNTGGIIAAAGDIQRKLSAAGFSFCVIGGVALLRWGEPRYTQDVDLTLLCPFGAERSFGRRLEALIPPRIDDAIEFSQKARVYLGRTINGVPVDIALGAIDFEKRCVERSSMYEVAEDVLIRTCVAEDLIVMKVFANRDRDWADVAGIIARQGEAIDWKMVNIELKTLLEVRGGEDVLLRLQKMRDAAY